MIKKIINEPPTNTEWIEEMQEVTGLTKKDYLLITIWSVVLFALSFCFVVFLIFLIHIL